MPEASSAVITTQVTPRDVKFGTVEVEGLKIAYREAGDPKAPKLVLLHGFPASSHQYRNLVPALADRFHVIAPDYPGFGESDAPDPASWAYTFDHLAEVTAKFLSAKGFTRYGLFAQDYGGPVGFRLTWRPRISATLCAIIPPAPVAVLPPPARGRLDRAAVYLSLVLPELVMNWRSEPQTKHASSV